MYYGVFRAWVEEGDLRMHRVVRMYFSSHPNGSASLTSNIYVLYARPPEDRCVPGTRQSSVIVVDGRACT